MKEKEEAVLSGCPQDRAGHPWMGSVLRRGDIPGWDQRWGRAWAAWMGPSAGAEGLGSPGWDQRWGGGVVGAMGAEEQESAGVLAGAQHASPPLGGALERKVGVSGCCRVCTGAGPRCPPARPEKAGSEWSAPCLAPPGGRENVPAVRLPRRR